MPLPAHQGSRARKRSPEAVRRSLGRQNAAVIGSGPMRPSGLSSLPIRSMSAASRLKSKTSMFCCSRSGVTVLGMTIRPESRCQRMTTWAGVFPCLAAISARTGSCRSWPWPSGLQDSVLIPSRSWTARRGPLLEPRVQLDLIDGRRHTRLVDDPLQMVFVEVRHADRSGPPVLAQLHQRLPGLDEAALLGRRPVDQVEVDRLSLEPLRAGLEGPQGLVEALVGIPQLGRQEHVLSRQRVADAVLVVIGRRRIDGAITGLHGKAHDLAASPAGVRQTPRPSCGIVVPSFSVTSLC